MVLPIDNGKNRIATVTGSTKSKIATDIGSDGSRIADSTKNKENEINITNSKGRTKTENQVSLSRRENYFSIIHEKQKEPARDCNSNNEESEDKCQEQKGDDPSISVSDVEIRLKNFEITPSDKKNIELKFQKLTVTIPEGELCERSPIGTEKCHRSNYSPYSVCSSISFSGF
jgi:hypothetical protein